MNADHDTQQPESRGAAGTTPAGHREQVLAAIGWERDPRRRRVARRLLGDEAERAYLYAYGRSGHKAKAVDQTRRALLHSARTLEEIPEQLSLAAWIFLRLEEEIARKADCPDPAQVLATTPVDPATAGEAGEAAHRHLDAHPRCRILVDAYRRYLSVSEDEDLRSRAGWRQVAADLDGFLDGQFGEEDPQAAAGRVPWAHWLPVRGWRPSRSVAVLVAATVVVLAILFWRTYSTDHGPTWSESAESAESPVQPAPVPAGPAPEPIRDASVELENGDLVFRWNPSPAAQRYSLFVLSAKLDTLRAAQFLTGTQVRIARSEIPQIAPGGSYLFRVDGLDDRRVVASTGFTPFSIPGR